MTLERDLERLYDESKQALFACALAVAGCPDMAEDAVQEAFSRMLRLEEPPRYLKTYAFRAVRNAAIDLWRRNGRTESLPEEDFIFDPADNPRQTAEKSEFQRRAAKALLAIDPDERETIVQSIYADLTLREIAEIRGAPLGTVASWRRRGLAKLRDLLEE